jgi:hypothetical protein
MSCMSHLPISGTHDANRDVGSLIIQFPKSQSGKDHGMLDRVYLFCRHSTHTGTSCIYLRV